MNDPPAEQVRKHTKVYIAVGGALLILTAVTVSASLFEFAVLAAVTIGLLIAALKGSLVAFYFMHLNHERKLIYGALVFTAIFFFALLLLPVCSFMDSYADAPIYVP